jgi:hypothetical protein
MTGAEIKLKVQAALLWNSVDPSPAVVIAAALDGCVILTAEEAEKVRACVRHMGCSVSLQPDHCDCGAGEALALLEGGGPSACCEAALAATDDRTVAERSEKQGATWESCTEGLDGVDRLAQIEQRLRVQDIRETYFWSDEHVRWLVGELRQARKERDAAVGNKGCCLDESCEAARERDRFREALEQIASVRMLKSRDTLIEIARAALAGDDKP